MRRFIGSSIVAALAALTTISCKETVLQVIDVSTVSVTGATAPVLIGAQTQLTARALDDRGNELTRRPVSWSSSNPTVASVDGSGFVRGLSAGSAEITAAVEGVNGSASVTVHFPAPTITATNPTSVVMQSAAFTLTVTGTNFTPTSVVRWNGANRTTTFVNATTLNAAIPASDVALPSYAQITVSTPAPGGGISAARQLAVRINVNGPLIAAGDSHTCALSGFTAYCWGINSSNQIGDGTSVDRLIATAVSGGYSFTSLSTSGLTTCGLDLIGLAYCWGNTGLGIRGQGTGAAGNTPNAVADAKQYRSLSVGSSHACAVDLAGAAWCWGSNFAGEIGNNTTTDQTRPTAVLGSVTFSTIAAGRNFTCALAASGAPYCWGENGGGQLGNGSNTDRLVPTAVQTSLTFVNIFAGDQYSCARTSAGALYCWGFGFAGQLGQGSFTPALTPVVNQTPAVATADAGAAHACGLTAAGALYCWGDNEYGQLGVGNTVDRNAAVLISGLPNVRDVSSGARHTCALTTNAEVYCWGSKGRGQLGDGTTAYRFSPAQVSGGATPFTAVQVGDEISCGLRNTGRVSCWGTSRNGQVGNGVNNDAISNSPTDVSGANTYLALAVGSAHACAIVSGTRVAQCWGWNISGQLGTGGGTESSIPATVAGGQQYQQIGAGQNHTCAVTTAGQVFCWGTNSSGQLGNGTFNFSTTPVAVSAPAGVTFNSVATGSSHSCATSTTGALYCWGSNSRGELGDATALTRNAPVQVSGLTGIVEVSAGFFHTCARNNAGAAWCWGFNGVGELGNGQSGSAAGSLVPVPVSGSLSFRSISAGRQTTCGVTTANQGYCWGLGGGGTLGLGSFGGGNTPQPVAGGLSLSSIDMWSNHTCGITTAGAAYCWGFMRVGELGIGQTGIEWAPRRMQGGVFQVLSRHRMRI